MILMMFLTALIASVRPVQPYEVPEGTDVYTVASGRWDWGSRPETCKDNPHTITFSAARDTMFLTFVTPLEGSTEREVRYALRDVTGSSIRGFMIGETRKSDSGELVVWDLVLTSGNSYRWRGTDWPPGAYTPEVVRCFGDSPATR